jgi:outer membrane protein assembly factor BamA
VAYRSQSDWIARILSAIALICALSISSSAQDQQAEAAAKQPASTATEVRQTLPSYEGQKISSLEIAGRPDLDTAALQNLLPLKEGDAFSRAKLNESIAKLKATGGFQDVQLDVVPAITGVRILLVLQPGMYFGMYNFPGAAPPFSYSRLLQVANYPPEGPYTSSDVSKARDDLEKFLQRNGYFRAKVSPELVTDAKHGIVNVLFRTELGKRAKFGTTTLEGTTPERTAALKKKLRSVMARLRGASIREGKTYKYRTLQNASQYLTNTLIKQDRLNAQVTLIGANYDPETNRADVSFRVEEGPEIKVKVQGARLWGRTQRRLLPIYQQVGADPSVIEEGSQNLVSHFQSKGYFEVQVKSDVRQQPKGKIVLYTIDKGLKHRVTNVHIHGNREVDDAELEPSVAVTKAGFLSRGKYSDKLVRTSVKNLESIYRAAGFASAKVTPQVRHSGTNIEVTFLVNEGPRDFVDALHIEGNYTQPIEVLAPKGLRLAPGQPYSQKLADEDRTQIATRYLELGYLTATFRETVRATPDDPHRVIVTYQIREGPQVFTSSVVTIGKDHTTQEFIDRTARMQAGKPLSEDSMLNSENRLYAPGIFDWAQVDPRRQITTQTQEDVLVKVHEARRNTLIYGFGFEVINRGGSVPSGTVAVPGLPPVGLPSTFKTSEKTFWGPRGTIEYTRRNIRGKAETLTFSAFAGRLSQRAAITYQIPSFRYSGWSASAFISGEHNSENPIFTFRQADVGFQFQKPLDAKRIKNVLLRYDLRKTRITDLLIPDLVPPEDRDVRLSTVSATYTRDTRDNTLDAHKGIYQSYEFALNTIPLGSSVNFLRFLGQNSYFRPMPAGIVWANSIRLGLEQPFADSRVPLSEKFFSGGGSTLRGFPLNGAGPQHTIPACGDPTNPSTCSLITVPVGGPELLILNSEFRIPVPISLPILKKGLGLVAFYDGGNVFPKIGFKGQYTNTLGGGFRYATPVGPVRIDIGHNLNAPPGIKSTQIFVTLGQAF